MIDKGIEIIYYFVVIINIKFMEPIVFCYSHLFSLLYVYVLNLQKRKHLLKKSMILLDICKENLRFTLHPLNSVTKRVILRDLFSQFIATNSCLLDQFFDIADVFTST